LVALYEHEGWRALGYDSFRACLLSEFEHSVSYLYRQLATGLLEQRLPIGDGNKESHIRPLITLLDKDEDIVSAHKLAQAMSPEPTAQHYQSAAYYVRVINGDNHVLAKRMESGELSPRSAYTIMRELDSLPERLVAVCSMCTDPALVPMLRRLYFDESDTWGEIEATGHIPSVDEQIPISLASASNLQAYLNIASNEHRAAAIELRREHYDGIKEAVDMVIAEARKVAHLHDSLRKAIETYDQRKVIDNV